MVGSDFFDGFLTAGFLPGVRAVTVESPNGGSPVVLDARREGATEDQRAIAGVLAGAEAETFFFYVDQTGYVRPRSRWKITDTGGDGTVWYVLTDIQDIQQRALVAVCTREQN